MRALTENKDLPFDYILGNLTANKSKACLGLLAAKKLQKAPHPLSLLHSLNHSNCRLGLITIENLIELLGHLSIFLLQSLH
jgi:hypothetical protein